MRRSISSARSPTLCSRCSSAKVVSMCRIAMTLAKLVIMITVSTSRKPPKVNCPIENENERMRWAKLVNGIDDPGRLRTGRNIRRNRCGGEQRSAASVRSEAGLLDHLGPQGDVGLDDVGELLRRRSRRLAARRIELLS